MSLNEHEEHELAERVRALEVTVSAMNEEVGRTRRRVHTLEGTTRGLVLAQRERNAGEERRNRERIEAEDARAKRFGRRLNVLAVVIAAAVALEPILRHIP